MKDKIKNCLYCNSKFTINCNAHKFCSYKCWYEKYLNTHQGRSTKFMHKKRFNGLRELVILKDEEKCRNCNLTRKEHKKIYGIDITVDHIDGNGRYSQIQNNNLNNLQTLCLKCHGSKDSINFWHLEGA